MLSTRDLWAVRMRTPDGTWRGRSDPGGFCWEAGMTTLTWTFEESRAAAEAVAADLRRGARRGTTVWVDPPERVAVSPIPDLEPWCGSWVVTRRATGEVVGEFYDRRMVERFDPATTVVETAQQYLARLNRAIREADATRLDG